MKKLSLYIIMGIFLMVSVSALDWDNWRYERDITFDGKTAIDNELLQKYPPIEIKNAFGLGDTILEGYISQHNETCGIGCQSTIEIKLHERSVLISNMIFKTQTEKGWIEQPVRNYLISYWEDIDDFKTECEIVGKWENGTDRAECSTIKTGSHKGWIPYVLGTELEAGIYKVRLDAQKKASRTVDWIMTTNGETITEWATWGSIGGGDDAEVILNSPTDASTFYYNQVQFNATANVTGGSTLTNMSLWTNETGTWTQYNLTYIAGAYVNDAHSLTLSNPSAQTAYGGMKIETNKAILVANITKHSSCTATKGYILDSSKNPLASADFVGDVATFNNYPLADATTYYLAGASAGASYTQYSEGGKTYPVADTNFDWTGGLLSGADDAVQAVNIISAITGTPINNDTIIVNRTLTDGIIWNVQGCDSDGDCGFATSNYSLLLDSSEPIIELEYPTGTINYGAVGQAETLNVTFTDTNLDKCWYNYNGTNISIEGCVSGVKNSTTFTLETGNTNITIFANDSLGNLNTTDYSWDYIIFQNSLDYSENTISGAIEDFYMNITYSNLFSGISVLFNYNGTNYSTTTSDSGYTREYSYIGLSIPQVASAENKTFYYIISLSNATGTFNFFSDEYNQTVNPFLMDNCTTYTYPLLNFTMFDEETLDAKNGTINVNVNIYSYGTTTLVNQYNASFDYVIGEQSAICLANITQNYTMAYEIQHYVNDSWFKKYRNIQSMTINNESIAQNLSLYNLEEDKGETFDVVVVGNLLSATGNADLLVDTQRQYLALNEFKSIESSVTSSNGVAITHLIQSDEVYTFIVSYNGETLGTFNNYRVVCQNELTGQCSITLNLAQATGTVPDFDNYGDISQVLLLDSSTNILYHTFSSTDGESHTVRSLVLQDDGYGNTTICNNSASGTSGTIQCSIPSAYQNSSIFVQTFVDGQYVGSRYFSQGVEIDWMGADIFIMLLMFSSIVLLLIGHPILIIIGAIIGIFSPVLLLYVTGASFSSIAGSLMFYLVGGIIAIWQISRRLR